MRNLTILFSAIIMVVACSTLTAQRMNSLPAAITDTYGSGSAFWTSKGGDHKDAATGWALVMRLSGYDVAATPATAKASVENALLGNPQRVLLRNSGVKDGGNVVFTTGGVWKVAVKWFTHDGIQYWIVVECKNIGMSWGPVEPEVVTHIEYRTITVKEKCDSTSWSMPIDTVFGGVDFTFSKNKCGDVQLIPKSITKVVKNYYNLGAQYTKGRLVAPKKAAPKTCCKKRAKRCNCCGQPRATCGGCCKGRALNILAALRLDIRKTTINLPPADPTDDGGPWTGDGAEPDGEPWTGDGAEPDGDDGGPWTGDGDDGDGG